MVDFISFEVVYLELSEKLVELAWNDSIAETLSSFRLGLCVSFLRYFAKHLESV